MASFLTGSGVNGGWGGYEVPVFGATQSFQYAAYVQDNWKMTPKLTVNLGVRYDLNTPRTDRFDRGSYFDPNAPSPLAGQVEGFPNLKGVGQVCQLGGPSVLLLGQEQCRSARRLRLPG